MNYINSWLNKQFSSLRCQIRIYNNTVIENRHFSLPFIYKNICMCNNVYLILLHSICSYMLINV